MTNRTPPAQPGNNRIGDILFWLAVVVLSLTAAGLIGALVLDQWRINQAVPTEIIYAPPTSTATRIPPPASATPTLTPALTPTEWAIEAPENPAGTPAVEQTPLPDFDFQDEFSDPNSGWSTVSRSASTRNYEGGAYLIEITAARVYGVSFIPVEGSPALLSFDAAVVDPASGTFGVLCQYTDEANFYLVEINPQAAQVSLGQRQAGNFRPLSDPEWQALSGFNNAPLAINHLEIVCTPELLRVSANGETPVEASALNPAGGSRAALFVAGGRNLPPGGVTRVYFDQFAARIEP
jgi:hypothetical protein